MLGNKIYHIWYSNFKERDRYRPLETLFCWKLILTLSLASLGNKIYHILSISCYSNFKEKDRYRPLETLFGWKLILTLPISWIQARAGLILRAMGFLYNFKEEYILFVT